MKPVNGATPSMTGASLSTMTLIFDSTSDVFPPSSVRSTTADVFPFFDKSGFFLYEHLTSVASLIFLTSSLAFNFPSTSIITEPAASAFGALVSLTINRDSRTFPLASICTFCSPTWSRLISDASVTNFPFTLSFFMKSFTSSSVPASRITFRLTGLEKNIRRNNSMTAIKAPSIHAARTASAIKRRRLLLRSFSSRILLCWPERRRLMSSGLSDSVCRSFCVLLSCVSSAFSLSSRD